LAGHGAVGYEVADMASRLGRSRAHVQVPVVDRLRLAVGVCAMPRWVRGDRWGRWALPRQLPPGVVLAKRRVRRRLGNTRHACQGQSVGAGEPMQVLEV
jgi:hypothetical protein